MRGTGIGMAIIAALALGISAPAGRCEVLGTATAPLDSSRARERECSLGDLAADAARASVGAQVALVQASLLRPQTLPAGDLTREALTGALLYPEEQIVLVEISGQQIRSALERGVSMLPKPSTGFLQVAGVSVVFRPDLKAGQRVTQVKVGDTAISPDKAYRVAMPASLAKGGLGYYRIFDGLKPKQMGPKLGNAVCDYVRAARKITPATGRLRPVGESAK